MPICEHCGNQNTSDHGHCIACGNELAGYKQAVALESVTAPVAHSLSSQSLVLTGMAAHNNGPQGLGGWLSLFFIGIVLLSPLLNLLDGLNSHNFFSFIFCLWFALYEIFIGVLIARSSVKALTHLRIYFAICIVLGLSNVASASTIGFRNIVGAIAWTLYFRFSKRVFNTFGRNL
jgi:hypothetical protein